MASLGPGEDVPRFRVRVLIALLQALKIQIAIIQACYLHELDQWRAILCRWVCRQLSMKSFETGPPRIACAIVPITGRNPIVPRSSTPCKMSDRLGTTHTSYCRASCGELRPLVMERTEGVDGEDLPRSKRDVMAELLHQPVIDVARLGALAQDGLPDPKATRPLAWKVG